MIARNIHSLYGNDIPMLKFTSGATPIVQASTPIVTLTAGVLVACADDAVLQVGVMISDTAANGEGTVVPGISGIVFDIPVEADDTGGGAPVVGTNYGLEVGTDGIQYLNVDETAAPLFHVLAYDATAHIATVTFVNDTCQV